RPGRGRAPPPSDRLRTRGGRGGMHRPDAPSARLSPGAVGARARRGRPRGGCGRRRHDDGRGPPADRRARGESGGHVSGMERESGHVGNGGDAVEKTLKLTRRVLVVDDEPGVRESLRMALKDGYEPIAVASGPEALQTLASTPVDVVLLDIIMP